MSDLLSIVVPVFNEEATVRAVIERLLAIDLPVAREILVVNDGSTDGTRRVLDDLPAQADVLRIVHAPVNSGKGRAIRTGFEHARGTIVAIQDADLELDPAELATLVQPILDGESSVVYGSRFLLPQRAHDARWGPLAPHHAHSESRVQARRVSAPWLSVAANRFLTGVTNVLFGSRLTDMETCYKVMRTELARGLNLQANRFDIEPEITAKLLRAGHTILERPVKFEPRSRSQGKKIGWRDGVQAIIVLVKYRLGR